MEDKLDLHKVFHNKMLYDHLDMKKQLMVVDYEMLDLEYKLKDSKEK
jgi:hypothetical protein